MRILPESLAAKALLFMAIFLYGKYVNWRKLKETRTYLIKLIVAIVGAAILDRLHAFLYSTNLTHEFISGLEIAITVGIGVFWYKEYKKTKKKETEGIDKK